MALENLHDLLVDELKDLYSAEKQLVRALPRLAKAAKHPQLRAALEKHLRETGGQVSRLERIGEEMDAPLRGKKCVGMEGLVEEGKELLAEKPQPDVLEAGLIGAAQKVEHYEMAAYGTARAHAEQLGLSSVARMLQQTLEEESAANETLTMIAESMVNPEAAHRADGSNGGRRS